MNLSLLGKQVWRLLTRTDSLVAKVYKSRYYPTCSLFEATIGSNPYFLWRGMMEALSAIKDDCYRSIGNGEGTLTGDPWLPLSDNPYVTTELHEFITTALVSSLFAMHEAKWDVDCVRDVFNARDADAIHNIPVSQRQPLDKWVWVGDPKGAYTVKSFYRKLVGEFPEDNPWHLIWNL
ncbi:PREDICTED: uncharacterized protein LOC109172172 [Ipomoea nil]|uniref:uncharacterized protein LOC109172172 n=1 Tax=Ipomoea nil TaxID=35883 RepID=UPI000901F8D9|nr:PREDICTED: uncharacterized protein LOC109172172 [Ipomoea nil]